MFLAACSFRIRNTVPVTCVILSVYREIDTIAAYIKSRGSKLPCMTAVQTVSVPELALIAENCPNLDILGVNDYYGSFGAIRVRLAESRIQ